MSDNERKLVQAYEKYAEQTQAFFSQSRDKTLDALEQALETAREQLVKAGEFTQEESREFKTYLRRDLEHTAKDFQKLGDQARRSSSPAAWQAGFLDLTKYIAESATGLFESLAEWADTAAVYSTGEIAAPGTFRCRDCKEEIHFKATGRIPPCPKCHKTHYRRVG